MAAWRGPERCYGLAVAAGEAAAAEAVFATDAGAAGLTGATVAAAADCALEAAAGEIVAHLAWNSALALSNSVILASEARLTVTEVVLPVDAFSTPSTKPSLRSASIRAVNATQAGSTLGPAAGAIDDVVRLEPISGLPSLAQPAASRPATAAVIRCKVRLVIFVPPKNLIPRLHAKSSRTRQHGAKAAALVDGGDDCPLTAANLWKASLVALARRFLGPREPALRHRAPRAILPGQSDAGLFMGRAG